MGHEIVIGLHFYQPQRSATRPDLADISTDPEKKDWTAIIEKQCYEPLAQEGVLRKASFDIYQSLLIRLEELDPQVADIYKKSMLTNGIGEAFIHPILPNLSNLDKNIVIAAGVSRFKAITGQTPKIFWPPETAIDQDTLESLVGNGYQGFICAPEQIIQSDGTDSNNQPTRINLKNGQSLIAFPFDREISNHLAFDHEAKKNADQFTATIIKPKNEQIKKTQRIIAWTDAETFGHHSPLSDKFLSYLLETSLPQTGLYPVSINSLLETDLELPEGRIVERSAWSCPHGNLVRWQDSCGCNEGKDTSWKRPFSSAMEYLNRSVSEIIAQQVGPSYSSLVVENFYNHFAHPKLINDTTKALVAAKISSLVAQTSCATFFSSPEVSGKINLLYAYQALVYLQESGLSNVAATLSNNFYRQLSSITYPNSRDTALTTLNKMLGHRATCYT